MSGTSRPAAVPPIRRPFGQLAAFSVVGLVNTAGYYACYLLLLRALPYLAAHIVAFTVSMVGAFFLHARFTYRTRPTRRKFLLFPLSNLTNFLVTTCGVYLLVDVLGVTSGFAPLLAAVAAVPVTFLASRAIMLSDRTAG
ncbi:GtrA family protein [Streptomyces litchfieldiae]|uniref:GtrA family protein n=1 Tax=Streptomyces litchfieldiae TaxID=3075543 RepID=A0ABU2ML41_9ACTN|nr:GtrA family protein [Streptomyces sp. DSM 44938]MDT0342319.1 GtrA family protein [Streptomyces sp. DSM 44938]